MSQDKPVPGLSKSHAAEADHSDLSDDLTRIVNYLDTKRSASNERASGLVQELRHRREAISDPVAAALPVTSEVQASPQLDMAIAQPTASTDLDLDGIHQRASAIASSNPAIAERFHVFCHELDVMLATFRARVEGDKPVQH